MTKEKQIEEMAHIMCGMEDSCDNCMFNKVNCYDRLDAEQIYNAGYRKASDVAREIFEVTDILGTYNPELYAELKKKYTEEGK